MRTLLLGLDGLDPDLAEEFDLQNIESVGKGFEIGTHGNSGPSWASVITGVEPSIHGVRKLEPQSNSQSWEGTPIWEKINGYCGIANVPLTYPPQEIKGWMVSGLMTPNKAIYTHPPNLYKELDELDYRIDMWEDNHKNHPHGHFGTVPFNFSEDHMENKLEELKTVLEKRTIGFRYLIDTHPVDFAFLVYTTLDRVQHFTFNDKETVKEFYQKLDKEVGKLLEDIEDHVEIFITSDHGFRQIDMPSTDIVGEHRYEGFGCTNTDQQFKNLEELHEMVVTSANRNNINQRLSDLGYK